MPFYLSLATDDTDTDELQALTRAVCRDLRDEADIEATIATAESAPGTKGDLPLYGQIILATIGSGGIAVAFVNVLKAWLQKKSSLTIKLKDAAGKSLEFKAENMRDKEVKELAQIIQDTFRQDTVRQETVRQDTFRQETVKQELL